MSETAPDVKLLASIVMLFLHFSIHRCELRLFNIIIIYDLHKQYIYIIGNRGIYIRSNMCIYNYLFFSVTAEDEFLLNKSDSY